MTPLAKESPRAPWLFVAGVLLGMATAYTFLAESLGPLVVVVVCLLVAWDLYLAFFYGGSRA